MLDRAIAYFEYTDYAYQPRRCRNAQASAAWNGISLYFGTVKAGCTYPTSRATSLLGT